MVITIPNEKANAIVIIVFDVNPNNQQSLINAAINNSEQVMSKKSGFISASFHKSYDRKRVANYAPWERKEDVEAMFDVPKSKSYIEQMDQISSKLGSL